MNQRALPLLVAIVVVAAACGSDGDAAGDTLPDPSPQITEVPVTQVPTTAVPVTDPPVPITEPPVTTAVGDTAQAQLDAAVARWNQVGPASYTMVTRQICFCPDQEWQDTVVDGVVTDHLALNVDTPFDPGPATMLSLFANVQAVIDEGYARLDLAFDPETGALQRYFVDLDEQIADEESGIEVISFDQL